MIYLLSFWLIAHGLPTRKPSPQDQEFWKNLKRENVWSLCHRIEINYTYISLGENMNVKDRRIFLYQRKLEVWMWCFWQMTTYPICKNFLDYNMEYTSLSWQYTGSISASNEIRWLLNNICSMDWWNNSWNVSHEYKEANVTY